MTSPDRERLLARLLAQQGFSAPATVTIPRRPPGTQVPLTSAQQRLWFLDQLGAEGSLAGLRASYLVSAVFELIGDLDVDALAEVLADVVHRHEALRTGIVARDGVPVQIVADDAGSPLQRFDVTDRPDPEAALREVVAEQTGRPFDLARPPLLRAAVVRAGRDRHVLVLVAHHIACDDQSLGLVLGELAAGYRQRRAGQPLMDEAGGPQFADYALWQQGRRTEDQRAQAEKYWVEQLSGVPAVLELPSDRPRPARPSGRGGSVPVRSSPALATAVSGVAAAGGTTPFTVLVAAVGLTLARYAQQDEVLIGTPVANRPLPELDRVVGMFVNTVALRVDLRGDPTVGELLERVRRTCVEGIEYADVPLERVLELVNPPRALGRNPLFQVMLVLNPAGGGLALPGLSVRSLDVGESFSRFDLTMLVTDSSTGVRGQVDFNRDVFDDATVDGMAEDVVRAAAFLAGDRDRRISALDLAPPENVASSPTAAGPRGWSTARGVPPRSGDLMVVTGSVTDLVLDQATRTPDAYAVLTPDGDPLTYAELVATSARLAGRLQAAGAGPERVVGIALPTGPAALVAILATLRAGAAYLPLDPGHPEARLAGLLADADPCVLVVAPGAACPVPGFTGPVLAADDSEGPLLEERPIHPHALAYLIYTSGSSGAPKGVQVSHAALTNLAVGFRDRHGFGPGQRLLMLPPLTFDASVGDVFPAWVSGATLIPDPDPVTLGAAELCALVDRLGVTAIDTAAAQWQQWVRELSGRPAPPELASLRLVMIGGEAVRPDAVAAWGRLTGGRIRLVNHYGPTEATVCATTYETVDGTELGGAALPLGSPLPGVSVTVMDEQLRPVPVGVPGELCLGGVGLARGYAGRPDLTAAAFVPGPAGQRLYRTGDRVVRRRDGRLDFLGRTDRQVKIRGHRIELGEVESALVSHKAVREAAVLARTGPDGMAGLVAYVVPAGPAGVDRAGGGRDLPESLRSWCAQRLPEYLRPGSYVVLDRLPTTEHGKTDLAALPVPAQSAGPSGRPPRAGTESRLAALWSELLAAPAVGADDDFFDLGGHSLLIPTVTSRVRAEFGVPLPARALFDTPRLADLAAAIERLRQGDRLDDDADLTATLLRDAVLPPDVGAGLDAALTHPPNGAVLLTGGSGFLGGVLLAELLDRTPLRVRCLVRAEFPAAGLARLRDNLTALGVWRAEYADRIDVLCGDLDEPALGLGADAVPPLNAEVDAIYHVGGRTQAGAPYHFLAPANVGGTIELLRLAGHRYAVPVHYVSTLGVYLGGGFAGQTVTEADPPPATPDGLVTGYAQSKWVADALVRAARGRGLPVTVYRPARIGGHSRTGRWTAHEAFARIVTSFVQLGAAYLEDPDYDLAPVDHVAAAICWLSRQPAAAGQDFHFHNPARLSADDLLATLREAGYAVAAVGFEEYVERIERMQAKGGEVAVTPLRGLAQEETTTEAARFDCTRTEQATAVAGLVCPPADRALLHRYLADFVRTGVLPAPGSAA